MNEEERRRCCILGGCGCGSGGPEQRAAMKVWLEEKLQEIASEGFFKDADAVSKHVGKWLDGLFTDNPAGKHDDLGDDR